MSFRRIDNSLIRKSTAVLLCGGLLLFGYIILGGQKFKVPNYILPEIKYNLMEETNDELPDVKDCTTEYANTHRLQQDHPCVLELVRKQFSKEPFPRYVPYSNLNQKGRHDTSAGQSKAIMRLLRYKTSGFFVECGASDGEFFSNTLFIERFKNWTGLLIEPDPVSYNALLLRKRKAWHIPACLSLEMYPTQVTFKSQFQVGSIQENYLDGEKNSSETIIAQCFPFYSVLLAHGRRSVDFFSLDVEGHELKILKTVPWHKIDVKTIAVEWEHVKEGPEAIIDFMRQNGFVYFGNIAILSARDLIFVKDYLRDLRTDYDDDDTDT